MWRLRTLFVLLLNMPAVSLPADGTDWPCFHGPKRDSIAADTGLVQTWPQDGPKLLWTASGIGHGYSSVSIAGGRIFTAGMIEKQTHVTAMDMTGKELWQRLNGQSWQASDRQTWAVSYAGSRGTPTVDDDTVYHLSELGRLTSFDVQTGRQRWGVDIMRTFEAERPEYGYSESVLIQGDAVFCCPGGDRGYAVALDKKTGRTLWANSEIEDAVGNCSAVFASIDGVEQVITLSAQRVLSFDPDSGRLLWDYAFSNKRENNVADAIISDGLVYASSGYGGGSILLRPQRKGDGQWSIDPVWKSELLDNHHGGVLLVDGRLFGAGHEARGWFCLDFKTGRQLWQARGKGSLTYADDRLYCLDEKGTMNLVKATDDKWEPQGSFRVPRGGKGLYWAHPVVSGGRLYVRHSDRLYAYDVRGN